MIDAELARRKRKTIRLEMGLNSSTCFVSKALSRAWFNNGKE